MASATPLVVFAFGLSIAFALVIGWSELTSDPRLLRWSNMLGGASLLAMLMAFLGVRWETAGRERETPAPIHRDAQPDDVLRILDPRRARQFGQSDGPDVSARTHEGSSKRRTGRLRVTSVHSSLGEVEDLSPSGVRLRVHGRRGFKVGTRRVVNLQTADTSVDVTLEVVWTERAGRGLRVGARFVELPAGALEVIGALAVRGCDAHDV